MYVVEKLIRNFCLLTIFMVMEHPTEGNYEQVVVLVSTCGYISNITQQASVFFV